MRIVIGTLLHVVLPTVFRGGVFHAVVHFDLRFQLLVGRPEGTGLHPERKQHPLLQEIFPALSGHHLDDRGADINSGVGILDFGSRLKHQRRSRRDCRGLPQRSTSAPSAAFEISLLGANLKRETAGVVHDHADRQRVLRPFQGFDTVLVGNQNPEFPEFRKVFRDRIIQRNFTLFNQHRNRHAAETFGLRALHVDIVHRDRTPRSDIRIPDACRLLNPVLVEDVDRSRELSALHIRHQRILCKRGLRVHGTPVHRLTSGQDRRRGDQHHTFCQPIHSFLSSF